MNSSVLIFLAFGFWSLSVITLLSVLSLVLFFKLRSYSRGRDTANINLLKDERNRIAADIHDDVGAELTKLILMSRHLRQMQTFGDSEMKELVTRLEYCSIELVSKMNDVIWYLNTDNHLANVLFSYIRSHISSLNDTSGVRIDLQVDCQVEPGFRLLQEVPRNVLLLTKELLQNGIRHAKCGTICLNICLNKQAVLYINYKDDGVGFDLKKKPTGNGLTNIRHRVLDARGTLEIVTEPGRGCCIHIFLPVR